MKSKRKQKWLKYFWTKVLECGRVLWSIYWVPVIKVTKEFARLGSRKLQVLQWIYHRCNGHLRIVADLATLEIGIAARLAWGGTMRILGDFLNRVER